MSRRQIRCLLGQGFPRNDYRARHALQDCSGNINNIAGDGDLSDHAIGEHATVTGGVINVASGTYSSISGGSTNIASGSFSSVSGGKYNEASGDYSFVGGGGHPTNPDNSNIAYADYSAILGGAANKTGIATDSKTGRASCISGGFNNNTSEIYTSVSGGRENIASGQFSAVGGGQSQNATTYAGFKP